MTDKEDSIDVSSYAAVPVLVRFPPEASVRSNNNELIDISVKKEEQCPVRLKTFLPFWSMFIAFIFPKSVVIKASRKDVWSALMDVKNFRYHNAFHRNVETYKDTDGVEKYKMYLPLPVFFGGRFNNHIGLDIPYDDPKLDIMIEHVFVKDHENFVFAYGINKFFTQAIRIVWLSKHITKDGKEWSILHSYDSIQGFSGFFVRLFGLVSYFVKGFYLQHIGLKKWVEEGSALANL